MISEELTQRIKALAKEYRERRSNVIWALDRFPDYRRERQKPRIRVRAISQRWSLPTTSRTGRTGE